jgi:hypothetical protein
VSTVVFPPEHLDECGVENGRRVLSPLFPANDAFRHGVMSQTLDPGAGEREDWVRAVESLLRHRAFSGAEPDRTA